MLQVQESFSNYLNKSIQLKPAPGKSGADLIYFARDHRRMKFAVIRIENTGKATCNLPLKWNFREQLSLQGRIDKEWNAYATMSPHGLSPSPLWKNEKAMACSFIEAQRASRRLINVKDEFWDIAESIFLAIQKMHECNITHMDLNLGNILIQPQSQNVYIIDFEFIAAAWLSPGQQRACDYLFLLNDFVRKRRGGKIMLKDPVRIANLLNIIIREEDKNEALGAITKQLNQLREQTDLLKALTIVFPNINS